MFQLTRELISYNPGLILNVQSILSRLKQGKTTEDIPAILQGIFRPSVQPYLISWMQYDPREVIRQVKQPVLIVNGDNDIQISADNAEALAQARPDADKVIIEGMTHLLKQSEVTDPQRQKTTIYMDAAAPVSEKLVSVMADFIRRRSETPAPTQGFRAIACRRAIIIFSTTGTEKCPGNTNCRIFRSHCV